MTPDAPAIPLCPDRQRRWALPAVFAAIVLGLVAWQSRVTLLVWALDGGVAAMILLVATLAGAALLDLYRLGPLPTPWRWLLSTGLGVGFLSLLMLACGACGMIGGGRRLWCPLVLAGVGVLGLLRLIQTPRAAGPVADPGRTRWLWLWAAPFAALGALAASLPPGFLWQEEGFGYDVLEYHLQLPKEYYENGIIAYLPHNVYANFPSAAEMLYLFGDIVTAQTIEAWGVANCLNALLAALTVAAAWLAGRELSPGGGIVTAVLTASAGWLVYLSGLAYVENGMLFMGMLAAATLLRGAKMDAAQPRRRWALLAGTLTGFACGFKYTAVPSIALPIGLVLLVLWPGGAMAKLKAGAAFALAALLAFAPWLVKNAAMTGNPVFPLAGQVFTSYPPGWGDEEARHFAESHAPGPDESTVAARLRTAWSKLPADPRQRMGPILVALAAVGALRHRGRVELALAAALLVQLLVWVFATHLFARFTVPLLIPLALLAGRGAVDRKGALSVGFAVLLGVGVAFNLYTIARLYVEHAYAGGQRLNVEGASNAFTDGWVEGFEHLGVINHDLPADARVLLVGDARPFYVMRRCGYCVVFNRNLFAEVAERSARIEEVLAWLYGEGYTHVYVDWREIGRLRRSRYGFPNAIEPLLFAELEDAGLRRVRDFTSGEPPRVYGVLYELPPHE